MRRPNSWRQGCRRVLGSGGRRGGRCGSGRASVAIRTIAPKRVQDKLTRLFADVDPPVTRVAHTSFCATIERTLTSRAVTTVILHEFAAVRPVVAGEAITVGRAGTCRELAMASQFKTHRGRGGTMLRGGVFAHDAVKHGHDLLVFATRSNLVFQRLKLSEEGHRQS